MKQDTAMNTTYVALTVADGSPETSRAVCGACADAGQHASGVFPALNHKRGFWLLHACNA